MNDNGPSIETPENAAHADVLRLAGAADNSDIDLAQVALALAAIDYPGQPMAPYLQHLQELQHQVMAACTAPGHVDARAQALAQVIGGTHGYTGDTETYDDVRNANLMHTIERRKGLPVALGIIYIATARGLGWECNGINFPSHFMIRLELGQARRILDPFNRGKVMQIHDLREKLKSFGGEAAELKPEFYQPLGNRELLLRLLNNIVARAANAQDFSRAAEIMSRMVLIAPQVAGLWHDYAMMLAQTGAYGRAIQAMQSCAEHADDPKMRAYAEDALAKLRRHLN